MRWTRATRASQLPPVLLATILCLPEVLVPVPVSASTPVHPHHPRLFLHAEEIPQLKDRVRTTPGLRDAYELIRTFAYGSAMQSNLWVAPDELSAILVAWVVEDRDPKLLDRARRYLDAFEKAEGDGWTRPRLLKALAHAYDWLHGELTEAERNRCARRLEELGGKMRAQYRHSDYNNHVYLERGPIVYAGLALAGDGVADDFARSALEEGESLLKEHFLPAVDQVGGDGAGGWHESMSYWSFFAYELAHQLEAWRTATGEDLFGTLRSLRGSAAWLLHATRPHDGSMAPVGDIDTPARWGGQETMLLPLLAARYRHGLAQHLASLVPPRYPGHAWPLVLWHDPALEPVAPESLPLGDLFPGIGWAAMRSSWKEDAVWALFVCGDTYAAHQHSDQNSFVIAREGDLAADAGEYGARETAFHNTVLLGSGQRVWRADPRRTWGPTEPGGEFDTGEILAYEEHRLFTYVAGDASGAFAHGGDPGGAPRHVRRFLFLKPASFVVLDDVRWHGSPEPPRWLLHTRGEPEVRGKLLRAADGSGELLCETLLPRDVEITVRPQTGGRKERTYQRIDVVPRTWQDEGRFLHVLHARKRGDRESLARAEVGEQAGVLEVTVTAPDRTYRLALDAETAAGGEIEIAAADGRKLLERRLLPSGVLPHGAEGARLLERWDAAYRGDSRPPWDIGRPSPELMKALEAGVLPQGRAAVLGCGTGTNAVYLAGRGFEVTAVDIAPSALERARAKASRAGVQVRWVLADVLRLPELGRFDLVFDRGCYHGVRRQGAAAYVESLRRLSRSGTRVLILAGNANEPPPHRGPPRVREEELRRDFSELFTFEWLRETRFAAADPEAKGALAWSVLLRRKATDG